MKYRLSQPTPFSYVDIAAHPEYLLVAVICFGVIVYIVYRIARSKSVKPALPSTAASPIHITDLNLEMLPIPAGSFLMGSPASEPGRFTDETQHHVTLTKPFWLGKFLVTQGQYEKLMGNNPSYFKGARRPVEQVSWDDAMAFCKKLNDRERAAGRLPDGYEYALPTEAQWEYACRAGTTGATYNTKEAFKILAKANAPALDSIAWYAGNSSVNFDASGGSVDIPKEAQSEMQYPGAKGGTHNVGRKAANNFGLHDMLGNVFEWCSDWYGAYPADDVTDPVGAASGILRVVRGGSWGNGARRFRSASRNRSGPSPRNVVGFRLALKSYR